MSAITSISAVSTTTSSQFLRPAPISIQAPQTELAAIAEEATETLATTRQEAANGDQVAIRKLAKLQKAQKSGQTFHVRGAPSSEVKNDSEIATDESPNVAITPNATPASITRAFALDSQA